MNQKKSCFNVTVTLPLFLCVAFLAFAPATRAAQTVALVISPFQTNVLAGASTIVTATVTVTIAGGVVAVNLVASGQPAADTATFSTTSFTASGTATLTISNDTTTAAGNYPITIAASGGASSSQVFGLIVGNSVWTGGGADTNWSTSANWQTTPTAGSQVIFTDFGRSTTATTISNAVDSTTWLSSLQYAHGTNFQNTLIPSGVTLNVTNTGGLMVGSVGTYGFSTINTAVITGGGTLNVSNTAAKIVLNQGDFSLNGCRAVLDLSALSNFTANVYAIGIGSTHFQNAIAQRNSGTLYLARTNLIKLYLTNTLANYSTLGTPTNAIELAHAGSGNNAAALSSIYLGQTNAFYVDSMGFGKSKASASSAATMQFNPAFASPTAYFRGFGGNASRVTWWAIADMADNASSAQLAIGTNDFSLGTVDALVETMSLGRDCTPAHTSSGYNVGVLTFAAGTIDINNLILGNQVLGPINSQAGNLGIMNVNGAAAKLVVNNTLELGHTTLAFVPGTGGTNAAKTYGLLNIRNGGMVLANRIIVGAASTNNNSITISNATLVVTNGVGTLASYPTTFAVTNSTLRLNVTGITNIFCANLVSAGTSNLISPDSVAVFASYPKQVTLIKFTTPLGLGVANFALTNIPASAPGAYLSNNIANSSLDMVLPFDPRPVITAQPAAYSGNPGDNVTFNVSVSGNSATPLAYQWYLGATPLTNGSTGNGSTISGATTASLTLTSAQAGDDGNYTVIITNAYGSATNTPPAVLTISAGSIAPGITGPVNTTVIQNNNATFTASVSGNPVPAMQWQRNGVDIAGQTGSSYTVTNAQYLADNGAVFSIIATNVAGSVTNSATLTVIVPPTITSQPVSLVVTNTQAASFTVVATGVPTPTYQWSKNGTPISSAVNNTATNATLLIASTAASDIASYSVAISNPAGATNSATVTLTVNSIALTVAGLSPSNGQTGVCYDTPLYLNFSQTPTLRTAGKIRIYNVTNPATPVDTIDLGLSITANATYAANVQAYNFNGDTITNFPVIITGTKAAIYPHHGLITSNQTYYVTLDNGTFADSSGAYFLGITATNVWKFTTKLTGPANATNLVVAADGSGDFLTVQGAIDSVPANNTTPTIINIRNGFYTEEIDIKSKNNLDFRGQSRAGTLIGYPDNNWVNGNGAPWRSCFIVNGNDCSFESLTITNLTPLGGSQAEAMDVEGTRITFYNMELDSYQDTFLVHSASKLVYFQNCLIQGQTDFNWGYGTVYYTNCEVRCTVSGGHVTQPRSTAGTNGFGFINCRITQGYSGSSTYDLGRTIGNPSSTSEVLFYNCLMADVVTGYASDAGVAMADYGTSNLTASATKTLAFSTHSSGSDPFVIAIQSASTWLYGWQPSLAPNILTNPVSQTVNYASPATFTVVATGIPDPTYQWQHAGTNLLSGATSATLTVASATLADGGSYAVIVTTSTGTATSSSATLTVNPPPNTAPTFTAPPAGTNIAINVGVNLALACTATDSDTPAQTLTYSLLTGPSGATLNTNSGTLTWRPATAQANTANTVKVAVTDNGTPNLSATNSFTVTVNALSAPTTVAGSATYSGGQFSVSVGGQVGPDYYLQANTNLTDGTWTTVASTNSPASLPVILTDPNAGAQPQQFYRIVNGPPAP